MIGSCSLIKWKYKYKRFRGAFRRSGEVPSLISRELHIIQSIIFLDAASKDLVIDDNHQ